MNFGPKKLFAIVATVACLVATVAFSSSIFETNDAGFAQVKQAFYTGDLTVRSDPGTYWQLFGTIHTYGEASTFFFTADHEMGDARDQSISFQFNDGAKSTGSGSVRVLLPNTDAESMIQIHRKFKSMRGVMTRLVFPAIRNAFFQSGPHMSAAESYAERRNEFTSLVKDQLLYGILATKKEANVVVDEITGTEKTIYFARPIPCEGTENYCVNNFKRSEPSVFYEYNITLTNFVVDDIIYPEAVLAQIETQRAARMNIITKEAEAKEADARAKKAEAEARAQVAETRAKEEVAKTQMIVRAEATKEQAVLQAEQVKAVAKLEKEAAEYEKKKNILLGEGEATRKRLVMQADGALAQKLAAQVEIQKYWADAYSKRNVPSTVFGGGGADAYGDGGAKNFMQMLTLDAAQRLNVNMQAK